MNCIYKNKGSRRHCSKEGKEGKFCPGSGAFLNCYTPANPLNDVDFIKLQTINIDNYEAEIDKLKELLEKNPCLVGIIPVNSLPDVEVIERPPYCKFCFNARVYQPTEDDLLTGNTLDDTNDSSSIVVGENMKPHRSIMINSGNGEPVNIEFLEWSVTRDRWETVGKYYPKFCPECGRRLDEYNMKRNKDFPGAIIKATKNPNLTDILEDCKKFHGYFPYNKTSNTCFNNGAFLLALIDEYGYDAVNLWLEWCWDQMHWDKPFSYMWEHLQNFC